MDVASKGVVLLRNKILVMSAMFIGLIVLVILNISIPNGIGGVIHFGDSLLFIGATMLPKPYSLFVAALGPGIFNLVSPLGLVMWFPFTIVIKPIMALCFTNKGDTILGPIRNRIAPFLGAGINTVLYAVGNMILFDNWASGVASLPGLVIQGVGSIAFFFVFALALDVARVKKRVLLK